MTYEQEVEAIEFLLESGHSLRILKYGINAFCAKNKYLVYIGNKLYLFKNAKEAAAFYRQEWHKFKMYESMENARKIVSSWPKWKQEVLR